MEKKKVAGYVADGVLGLVIVFLLYCMVSMYITQGNNYGVPSVFGYSVLYVATDSMEGSYDTGTGLIIKKVDSSSVQVKDVITFYYPTLRAPDTHRVREILKGVEAGGSTSSSVTLEYDVSEYAGSASKDSVSYPVEDDGSFTFSEPGSYYVKLLEREDGTVRSYSFTISGSASDCSSTKTFYTRGDNLKAATCSVNPEGKCSTLTRETVPEKYYIGKVVRGSKFLGTVLTFVSPQAAASSGKNTTWVFPVLVLIPIVAISTISVVNSAKDAKKEAAAEKEEIAKAMQEAGVDPNDEAAVLLFTEKQQYKIEMRKTLEKEKEAAKKEYEKELKRQKALLKKEMKAKEKEEKANGPEKDS